MKKNYFHEEEQFHDRDRKQFRKDRKSAQSSDRSKFKKSDLDQQKKEQPTVHDLSLHLGRVVSISGEGVWVDVENARMLCSLKGLIKKEKMLSKNLIAVGDMVRVRPLSPEEGSIDSIEGRYSQLSRQDISGKKEQLIAVNIDLAIIVASIESPPLKPALIDRYLIAAELGQIPPIIVINKIDRLQHISVDERNLYSQFLLDYEKLGYPILSISTETNVGLDHLRSIMKNKASVFVGQSGVGKSSILNAAFGLKLKTGDLTQKTFKGSHTTTTAELLTLADGSYCIDTPGVRSFGVWNLKREDIANHFREFLPLAKNCRYPDCKHLNEPICEVMDGVKENKISLIRYESYVSLMDEIISGIDNRMKRKGLS